MDIQKHFDELQVLGGVVIAAMLHGFPGRYDVTANTVINNRELVPTAPVYTKTFSLGTVVRTLLVEEILDRASDVGWEQI